MVGAPGPRSYYSAMLPERRCPPIVGPQNNLQNSGKYSGRSDDTPEKYDNFKLEKSR